MIEMLYTHLPRKTSRLLAGLLVSSMAIVIVASLVYSFLAISYADDFCRASLGTSAGEWIRYVIRTYQDWSGRWVVHAIYALTFPFIDITSYKYNFLLLIAPILWFVGFYAVVRITLGKDVKIYHRVALSVILCAAYWAGMPNVGETWYWLTGLVEYGLPFLLSCLTLLVLTSDWVSDASVLKRVLSVSLATLMAFLVTGANEFIGILLAAVIAVGIVVCVIRRDFNVVLVYGIVFVPTIVGIGINVFAPGTAGHAASFSHPYSLLRAVALVVLRPDVSPFNRLIDPRLLFLSLILLPSQWFLSIKPEWLRWDLPCILKAVAVPIVTLLVVFGGYFVITFAQGQVPFARVLNILYATFICGWLVWLVAIAQYVPTDGKAENKFVRGINIAAGILFPLSLILSPNMTSAVRDFKDTLKWKRAIAERDNTVRKGVADGKMDMTLEPIDTHPWLMNGSHPSLFFWSELLSDDKQQGYWLNECFAKYYGAKRILVGPRSN